MLRRSREEKQLSQFTRDRAKGICVQNEIGHLKWDSLTEIQQYIFNGIALSFNTEVRNVLSNQELTHVVIQTNENGLYLELKTGDKLTENQKAFRERTLGAKPKEAESCFFLDQDTEEIAKMCFIPEETESGTIIHCWTYEPLNTAVN
jgi:hypothetical protein